MNAPFTINDRYVYVLFVDGDFDWKGIHYDSETPFYVGAGKGSRIKSHVLGAKGGWGSHPTKDQFILEALTQGKKIIEHKFDENLSLDEADELEKSLIIGCGRIDLGTGPLLNRLDGGYHGCGKNLSPVSRAKLAEHMRQRFADPAARAKQAEHMRQRFADPAERAKQAEHMRRYMADPAERAKLAERARRQMADPATLAKIGEAHHRYWEDPAARAKQAEHMRRYMADPAARAKAAEANRQYWEDPAARAKAAESAHRHWEDPATRAKQAERTRQRWKNPAAREKQAQTMLRHFRAARQATFDAKFISDPSFREWATECLNLTDYKPGGNHMFDEPQPQSEKPEVHSFANEATDQSESVGIAWQ
jgi:hypothetical protein